MDPNHPLVTLITSTSSITVVDANITVLVLDTWTETVSFQERYYCCQASDDKLHPSAFSAHRTSITPFMSFDQRCVKKICHRHLIGQSSVVFLPCDQRKIFKAQYTSRQHQLACKATIVFFFFLSLLAMNGSAEKPNTLPN